MWHCREPAQFDSFLEPLLLSFSSFHIASQTLDPIPTGQLTGDTQNVSLSLISADICNKVQIMNLSPSQECKVSFKTSEMVAVMAVAKL